MIFLTIFLMQYGLIESKEKREHDNQIIKTIPPIPEAGLLALNVILNNDTPNKNTEPNKNNDSNTENNKNKHQK